MERIDMKRSLSTISLVMALTVLSASVQATVLIPAGLDELAAEATAIVHGRVVDVRAEWTDGRRTIESFVTVGVATYLKGSLGPSVTFRTPGGEVGLYRSVMVGAPVFTPGDEIVLFLGSRGPSVPFVLGLNQGVYRVVTNARGERIVIKPALIATGETAVPVVRGDAARPAPTLERFAADVRALLARRR
jgi:hypothetical protein